MLEDLSDWYRGRSFSDSKDWDLLCSAWKSLGLMEVEEFSFGPINELSETSDTEIVFGALSPQAIQKVLESLEQIDGKALDQFISAHDLAVAVPFSEMVAALINELKPEQGLVIFAG